MKRDVTFKYEFVEFMPPSLADNTIYISIPYTTASHKCACGCGLEVVTPLAPTAWALTFDGEFISLWPSIGNWNFPCESHYWLIRNRVEWAPRWSRAEIEAGRASDHEERTEWFARHRDQGTPQHKRRGWSDWFTKE